MGLLARLRRVTLKLTEAPKQHCMLFGPQQVITDQPGQASSKACQSLEPR
jgi:hypothetical protein